MPVSLTCPTCDARLKAPDVAGGRTLRCPRCAGPVVVPAAAGPAAEFAFESAGPRPSAPADHPFEDESPAADAESGGDASPRRGRRPAAKRKPRPGYNPFDQEPTDEPATAPPKKRRYRKDGDFNPFGDAPEDEEPDPAGAGFDFGIEAPPPAPTGEFDFGRPETRGADPDRRRR